MIRNGVYVVQKDVKVNDDLNFKKNQEIEVVNNVIYIGGHPLDFNLQGIILNWMEHNLFLFKTDNRNF